MSDRTISGLSPVWSALRYISEGVAGLTCGIYRQQGTDTLPNPDHPINSILRRPHPHYTWFDFIQALVWNGCLGDGFARIYWDEATARPVALEHLPRHLVKVDYGRDGSLVYHVSGLLNGKPVNVVLSDREVIHIKGVTVTGVAGEKLTLTHREGFQAGIAAQEYTAAFFENGAHTNGAIIHPAELKLEQARLFRKKLQEQHAGSANAGKTLILDGGVKYERMSLGPQEAALVDFRRLSVEDTSRIFKMPLHMLSSLDRSTFSNIEQQEKDFFTHTLPPWTEKIAQEISYKLFTAREFASRRAFFQYDYTFAMQGDMDSMAKFFASAIQNGYMSLNEARQRLKLPMVEGGDRLFIQQNLMPVDMADEVLSSKSASEPAANTSEDNEPQQGTATE